MMWADSDLDSEGSPPNQTNGHSSHFLSSIIVDDSPMMWADSDLDSVGICRAVLPAIVVMCSSVEESRCSRGWTGQGAEEVFLN